MTSRDAGLDKKKLWKSITKDQRAEHARKFASLRERIRHSVRSGKDARTAAKAFCRAERLAAAERARAIIARMRLEALALAKAEREGAR